jgi:hypothetical protein
VAANGVKDGLGFIKLHPFVSYFAHPLQHLAPFVFDKVRQCILLSQVEDFEEPTRFAIADLMVRNGPSSAAFFELKNFSFNFNSSDYLIKTMSPRQSLSSFPLLLLLTILCVPLLIFLQRKNLFASKRLI